MARADDDERLGRLCRLLRRRLRMSQREPAGAAEVPREQVILIEAGRIGLVRVDRARRIFEVLGAQLRVNEWWHGAAADGLLDERHASLVEKAIRVLRARRWALVPELSFSEYGERGSIDILAAHEPTRAVLVVEVKSALGSLEETNRTLDAKQRLAPKLARGHFGWLPAATSRVLIVPDDRAVRRTVERYGETMTARYPLRSREFRAWLRRPLGSVAAIWFLSEVADSDRAIA